MYPHRYSTALKERLLGAHKGSLKGARAKDTSHVLALKAKHFNSK